MFGIKYYIVSVALSLTFWTWLLSLPWALGIVTLSGIATYILVQRQKTATAEALAEAFIRAGRTKTTALILSEHMRAPK